jgi:chemotaxis protein MotB
MATSARGRNEPPPPVIVVKKIVQASHEPHHGGAWKIAYADFVTAMMAFFLLMWLVGATDEQQRQGLADYFTPTLIEYKQNSAGADGIMGGDSIVAADNYPHKALQTGSRTIVIPRDTSGGVREASGPEWLETKRFAELKAELIRRIESNPNTRDLKNHVSFTQSDQGLRIDLVDEADFSMFEVGTDRLQAQAQQLIREVAQVIQGVPMRLWWRGTRFPAYGRGQVMKQLAAFPLPGGDHAHGAGADRRAAHPLQPDRGVATASPSWQATSRPAQRRISITLVGIRGSWHSQPGRRNAGDLGGGRAPWHRPSFAQRRGLWHQSRAARGLRIFRSAGGVTEKSSLETEIANSTARSASSCYAHRLVPSPGNYALLFHVMTDRTAPAA